MNQNVNIDSVISNAMLSINENTTQLCRLLQVAAHQIEDLQKKVQEQALVIEQQKAQIK